MTVRINLLPHREIARKARQQQFYVFCVVSMLAAGLIALAVHLFMGELISRQEQRNRFLEQEIAVLDKQIVEIRNLREQIDALLSRKKVIESLQGDRAESVHLLSELVRRMPEGVYLDQVEQKGKTVTIKGYAQSNARVSHLMRALEGSDYLHDPRLIEVQAATVSGRRVGEFRLQFGLRQPKAEGEAS